MTLREFANGYNGKILLKAYESAAEEEAIAIMENTNCEAVKDEILDREVDNYLIMPTVFHHYIRVNFNAVVEEPDNPAEEEEGADDTE